MLTRGCEALYLQRPDQFTGRSKPVFVAISLNALDDLNPESLVVLHDARVEEEAASARPGDYLQFIRNGSYMADSKDSSPEHLVFNRTVTLKDSWSKLKQKMGI